MLLQPDFSQIREDVGPGTYKVRITGAEVDKWAGKDGKPDTQFVKWEMETFGEAETKNNGRKIWDRTPITGGGAFKLQNLYKAAIGEQLSGQFDTDMLLGKELEVVVVQSARNPEYTEIKSYGSL